MRTRFRPAAARFSFLLSPPIILGAGLFQLLDPASARDPLAQVPALIAGFLAAAISGYVCIWALLRYLQRGRLYPFAVCCTWVGIPASSWPGCADSERPNLEEPEVENLIRFALSPAGQEIVGRRYGRIR